MEKPITKLPQKTEFELPKADYTDGFLLLEDAEQDHIDSIKNIIQSSEIAAEFSEDNKNLLISYRVETNEHFYALVKVLSETIKAINQFNQNSEHIPRSFSEIKDHPVRCSAEEFAKFFNRQRAEIIGSDKYEYLTNEDVEELIVLAFDASSAVEETRYPKFRFVLYPYNQAKDNHRTMVHFDEPIKLKTSADIYRLLPAVASPSYALRIIKKDNDFYCDAIVLSDDTELHFKVGSTDYRNVFGLTGISIRVNGPGDITVSQSGFRYFSYRFKAGKVEVKVHISEIQGFERFKEKLAKHLIKTYLKDAGEKSNHPFFANASEQYIESLIQYTWGVLLKLTSQAGHGGTFIIIPEYLESSQLSSKYSIDLKYKTTAPDIGSLITDFFRSSTDILDLEVTSDNTYDNARKAFSADWWLRQKNLLNSNIEQLANLANIDGCVVLDQSMKVLGFGGKISNTNAKLKSPSLLKGIFRFGTQLISGINVVYGKPMPITDKDLLEYGTRHKSAAKFCCDYPGSIAFVISQDGDIRCFVSDEFGFVYFYKQIAAFKGQLETF